MKKVLIIGGTGFLGRHICEQLTRQGVRVTVPTRRASNASHVQMLPQVDVVEADVNDAATLQRLVPGHDAVVNLVGVLHGSQQRFEKAHVVLPQALAKAMKAAGVTRLVHVSALGADAQASSRYQRTKAAGEAALRTAGLDLTVLRPSVVFGAEDHFLNLFAKLQATLPVLPLAGSNTRFQPVWVGDVAQAVVRCLQQADTIGQTYECAGPQVFTLKQLVQLAGRLSGHPRPVVGLPMVLGYFQALFMECLPGEPLMSTDNISSMETDNVATGELPGLADLGIAAAAVEPVAARYLDGAGSADRLLKVREHAGR